MTKRKRRDKRKTRETSLDPDLRLDIPLLPSAQTMFRMHLLNPTSQDMLSEALGKVSPETLSRDQGAIDRIEGAETLEEVLDMVTLASGLADRPWYRRMEAFGPEAAPMIAARLKSIQQLPDRSAHSVTYEHLLSALSLYGDAGIKAILACFDALSTYGKSLACIVLGRLSANDSADRLWDFYQGVKSDADESFFVGPLWGLVDLGDPRAADALDELLWSERFFYEAFAMAYKAGDARIVMPLIAAFQLGGETSKDYAIWALTGVAHRIGREALLAEIQHIGSDTGVSAEQHQSLTDRIFGLSQRAADEYFAVHYQGLTANDVDQEAIQAQVDMMEDARTLMQNQRFSDPIAPPPGERPGRNAPCWCGSGKKYKYCHWRQDRTQG